MEIPFPAAPTGVPPDLARPSRQFRLQAWAAITALLLFLCLYFGLTVWFARIAWSTFLGLRQGRSVAVSLFVGLPALFLFLVMVKGLFHVRRGATSGLVEVREQDEPVLFAFVRRIAHEVGAPQPHRLFLSARVNAAVFYDTALWNLVVPAKKNLEIGLGLVNALSLDEFKAVIAHEFGHFAQRSMAVGRWVYLTQQFVADLIVRRDMLDRFLDTLSRIDLRIAWIGWAMRLIVWSIRSLLDTAFRGVIALERALGRQMEFQADLVAASATGSDSLVHALSRIMAADDAWDRAVDFVLGESRRERPVADVFSIQSRVLERMRDVLDDPRHGVTPVVPETDPHRFRVFQSGIAESPRMWATHPPNHEREESAKREYVPSVIDDRPAWVLFADPGRLRLDTTSRLLTDAGIEAKQPPVPLADSLQAVDEQFRRPSLDARYQGVYLGRSLGRHARDISALYGAPNAAGREEVLRRIDALYPPLVRQQVRRWRDLVQEKSALEGLRQGWLTAVGGVLRFRGRQVRRKELPRLIQHVDDEIHEVEEQLREHDREVRSVHLEAARLIDEDRESQLVGLMALVHYAEHTQAALNDVAGHLQHVFALATADQKVTRSELDRLQVASARVFDVLQRIYEQRKIVCWTESASDGERSCDLGQLLPDGFALSAPSVEDLAQGWLEALEVYLRCYDHALSALQARSLDMLIAAEAEVAGILRSGRITSGAATSTVPKTYRRVLPGEEKPRTERLGWWERFQIADGVLPGAARLAAAACILSPALLYSWSMDRTTLVAHNGLGAPVRVEIAGRSRVVAPRDSVRLSVSQGNVRVRAEAPDGVEIERFEAEICESCTMVYNVAGASSLVEWTAAYGSALPRPSRFFGAPRLLASDADHVFEDPPQSIRLEGGGVSLRVLHALDSEPPWVQANTLDSDEERRRVALAHARWDPLDQPDTAIWMTALADSPDLGPAWRSRLDDSTQDVGLQRIRMDTATEEERRKLCESHIARGESAPENADLTYLAIRCLPDGPEKNDRFLRGSERFPDHMWLSWASYATRLRQGELAPALAALESLIQRDDVRRSILGFQVDEDFVRLRRWSAPEPGTASLDPVDRLSPQILQMLAVESWSRPPATSSPHERATFLLLHGDLGRALAVRGLSPSEHRSLALRVALSDDATPEQVSAGRAVLPSTSDEPTLFLPALALAIREGWDVSKLREAMSERPGLTEGLPEGLTELGVRTPIAAFERAAGSLSLEARGASRLAGIVLLGDAAPGDWRREAKALLLPYERPFLR